MYLRKNAKIFIATTGSARGLVIWLDDSDCTIKVSNLLNSWRAQQIKYLVCALHEDVIESK